MKQISLSRAYLESVQAELGAEAAVDAICTEIGRHLRYFPVALRVHGSLPNKVASLSFVKAATWNAESEKFTSALLTCGFGDNDKLAITDLMKTLTNPKKLIEHPEEGDVFGLIVGVAEAPAAFITLER